MNPEWIILIFINWMNKLKRNKFSLFIAYVGSFTVYDELLPLIQKITINIDTHANTIGR